MSMEHSERQAWLGILRISGILKIKPGGSAVMQGMGSPGNRNVEVAKTFKLAREGEKTPRKSHRHQGNIPICFL